MRNQRMIDEGKPDLVVAFPGGSGTADMVRRAKRASIEVMEVDG
jgi:predicted Rossmann-fold nucleotide-binding protein